MTPLEFFISVRNSDAKAGIQEVQQQVNSFKDSANELYEGPAREMRIRTEFRGMIKDIAMGKDPLYSLIGIFERLSEVARFAGPVAAALAVGFGLNQGMRNASAAATDFFDLFAKGMSVSVRTASEEALKELLKTLDQAEEKYKKRGFFERVLFGASEDKAMHGLADLRADAMAKIESMETARIEAHTAALRKMTDDDLAREGEVEAAQADYADKAARAREAGQETAALAWEQQMGAAIDRINDKYKKAQEEQFAKGAALVADLVKAQTAADAPEDRLAALQKQRDDLQAKVDGTALPSLNEKDAMAYTRNQTDLANLQRDINVEEARLAKEKADKQKEADAATVSAADKTAKLADETHRAQFENLSKEEKLIVLRAEQNRLETELTRMVWSRDSRFLLQKSLATVQKDLADLNKPEKIASDSFEQAGGRYAGANYGRVANDSSDRAEKQRSEMCGYLRTLAQRGNPSDTSPF